MQPFYQTQQCYLLFQYTLAAIDHVKCLCAGHISDTPLTEQSELLVKQYLFKPLPDSFLPSTGSQVLQWLFDFTELKHHCSISRCSPFRDLSNVRYLCWWQPQLLPHLQICCRQHPTCHSTVNRTPLYTCAASLSDAGRPWQHTAQPICSMT